MDAIEGKRGQIIDAAVAEFQESGFAGASMDRISARAGVSKRTVYNHFESKESLFRAIIELMAENATEAFDIRFEPSDSIEKQLHDLAWAEGKLFTNPNFMKLARMVIGETMRDPALAQEFSSRMDPHAEIHSFLAAAAAEGRLSIPDVDLATSQFMGLLKTQGFWPGIYSGSVIDADSMGKIVDATVKMFLGQYAPS